MCERLSLRRREFLIWAGFFSGASLVAGKAVFSSLNQDLIRALTDALDLWHANEIAPPREIVFEGLAAGSLHDSYRKDFQLGKIYELEGLIISRSELAGLAMVAEIII